MITSFVILRAFSELIDISATYLSKIENGLKPAPKESVLEKIADVFMLNDDEKEQFYTAQKVDEVVISVLHECFKKLKVTPKDAAIEKRYKAQIKEIKQEIKKLEKETENLKRRMRDLAAEIANALIGDSKFIEEALSLAIDTAKAKIENNVSLIEEKRYQLNHKEADIQKMDYYYQQFVSWADEFDNASAERKRMILCTLFKEITIGKGYKIELLMDNSYEQFIA